MDKDKIYWDTCVFISYLGEEDRTPGELAGMDDVVRLVVSNKITSELYGLDTHIFEIGLSQRA
jgi:hypothetical protein